MSDNLYFILIAGLALLFNHIPLLHKPFLWMETYFHELSHGLAAIMTFGKIHRIYLRFNGAGLCKTMGGLRVPILLAGYFGAIAWGAFIYLSGWTLQTEQNADFLYILMAMQIATVVFWVRDLGTLFAMGAMIATFAFPIYLSVELGWYEWTAKITQFMGMYILMSAVRAPLLLIDGKHEGDGAMLADILYLPEGVWIALWFTFGCATVYWLWQITVGLPIITA